MLPLELMVESCRRKTQFYDDAAFIFHRATHVRRILYKSVQKYKI